MVPSTALVWLSDIFFQNKHELNTMLFFTVFAIVFIGVAATELPANQTVDYIGNVIFIYILRTILQKNH